MVKLRTTTLNQRNEPVQISVGNLVVPRRPSRETGKAMRQRTVSPVDGSVYVERELASGQDIENALARAVRSAEALEARAGGRARRDRAPHGRMVRRARRRARRGAHPADGPADRAQRRTRSAAASRSARCTCAASPRRRWRTSRRAEGRASALHPPRAARRRAGGRAVELSLAHVGERGGAGAARRQQRDPEDGAADAARRRALRRSLRGGRAAARACSSSCTWTTTQAARMIGDERIGFVAFTGSVRGGHAVQRAARGALHRHRPRARRQGPGLRARRRDARVRRSRTWSTAASSTPGQSCCGGRAHLRAPRRSSSRSSTASSSSTRAVPARQSARHGDDARPDGAHRGRRLACARRSRRPSRKGAKALIDPRDFPPTRPARRTCAPQVLVDVDHGMAGDDRGDLRPGGRHHAGRRTTSRRSSS